MKNIIFILLSAAVLLAVALFFGLRGCDRDEKSFAPAISPATSAIQHEETGERSTEQPLLSDMATVAAVATVPDIHSVPTVSDVPIVPQPPAARQPVPAESRVEATIPVEPAPETAMPKTAIPKDSAPKTPVPEILVLDAIPLKVPVPAKPFRYEVGVYGTAGLSMLYGEITAGSMRPAGISAGVGADFSWHFARRWMHYSFVQEVILFF
jgi:hypothetical protein